MTALVLIAALTGCVRNDIGITINKNGTGSVAVSVGIEKSTYDQLVSMGSEPFEGKKTEKVTYGDDTYITYTETKEYNSYEEIRKALLELTYNTDQLDKYNEALTDEPEEASGYTLYTPEAEKKDDHIFSSAEIKKDSGIFYSVYSVRASVNSRKSDDSNLGNSYKMTITVNMPEKITKSSDGKVDGKTVVFDFDDLSETNEIAAVSEVNNNAFIFILIGVLTAAAVVFVIIIKKKK